MTSSKEKIIEKIIYIIRDQKVMLDSDLALLYEVETRIINRNVQRNIGRFPPDFMFQLTTEEYETLRSNLGSQKKVKAVDDTCHMSLQKMELPCFQVF